MFSSRDLLKYWWPGLNFICEVLCHSSTFCSKHRLTVLTFVLKILTLFARNISLDVLTGLSQRINTALALPIPPFTSCSVPLSIAITLPRQVKEETSSTASLFSLIGFFFSLFIRNDLVISLLMVRPVICEVVASDWILFCGKGGRYHQQNPDLVVEREGSIGFLSCSPLTRSETYNTISIWWWWISLEWLQNLSVAAGSTIPGSCLLKLTPMITLGYCLCKMIPRLVQISRFVPTSFPGSLILPPLGTRLVENG